MVRQGRVTAGEVNPEVYRMCLRDAKSIASRIKDPEMAQMFAEVADEILSGAIDNVDAGDIDMVGKKLIKRFQRKKRDAIARKRNTSLTRQRSLESLEAHLQEGDKLADVVDRLRNTLIPKVDFNIGVRGRQTSLKFLKNKNSINDGIQGEVSSFLARIGFDKLRQLNSLFTRNNKLALDVRSELLGFDTGNLDAQEIAGRFAKVTDELFERRKAAGIGDDQIPNYFPRTTDLSKLTTEAEQQAWIDFLVENLDPEVHPDPEATAREVLATLDTKDIVPDDEFSVSARREMTFKNNEAELKYAEMYGEGSVGYLLEKNIRKLVTETILAEQFGPRPFYGMKLLASEIDKRVEAAPARAKGRENTIGDMTDSEYSKIRSEIDDAIQFMTGYRGMPHQMKSASWWQTLRNIPVITSLGSTMLYGLTVDAATSGFERARFMNTGFVRGVLGHYKDLITGVLAPNELKALNSELASTVLTTTGTGLERFNTYSPHGMSGAEQVSRTISGKAAEVTGKMAAFGSRLTMMDQIGERNISSLMNAFNITTTKMAKAGVEYDDIANYNRGMWQVFQENGITKDMWNRIKSEDKLGRMGIIDMSAEGFVKDPRARTAYLSMLVRTGRNGVAHPSLRTKMLLSGTADMLKTSSQVRLTALQFMQFEVSILQTALASASRQGLGPLAGLLGGLVVMGGVKTMMDDTAKGVPLQDFDNPLFWTRAMAQSGAMPIFGDYVYQMHRTSRMQSRGYTVQDFLEDRSGPMVSLTLDVADAMMRTGHDLLLDENPFSLDDRRAAESWINLAVRQIPYQNAWHINAAFVALTDKTWTDHVLDDNIFLRENRRRMRWAAEGRY